MRPSGIIIAAASIGLLASAGVAHAQGFFYSSTFTPSTISGGGGTAAGGSQINVTGQSLTEQTAPTDSVVANLTASSGNRPGTNSLSSAYTLTISLTEDVAGSPGAETQTHAFTGTISGNLGENSSDFAASPPGSSVTYDAPTGQLYTFSDGQTFLVTLGSFSGLGAPGLGTTTGTISAHITQTAAGVTPEPGSIALLMGLGASGSWITYRRRRRKL